MGAPPDALAFGEAGAGLFFQERAGFPAGVVCRRRLRLQHAGQVTEQVVEELGDALVT